MEWTAPEYPNGEVLNYKIKVYLKTDLNTPVQTGNLTADSTQYTTTGTLLAGKICFLYDPGLKNICHKVLPKLIRKLVAQAVGWLVPSRIS